MKQGLEIKWCTLGNADATATLKQHAYIRKKRTTPYIGEEYEGNAQLCNPGGYFSDDGESAMKFDEIEYYSNGPHAGACKKCLKIYNKILIVRTKS
jgi:hypothetical protein